MGDLGVLRVRLLGGLEVEGVEGRALGSRKARTLIKVLALARGRPVPADTVADALWPDDDAPTRSHGVGIGSAPPALHRTGFAKHPYTHRTLWMIASISGNSSPDGTWPAPIRWPARC